MGEIEVMRDIATGIGLSEIKKRKILYDKGKVDRQLKIGELVLCRIPGKNGKLEDAWEGPVRVVRKLSKVNNQVKEEQGENRREPSTLTMLNFTKRERLMCMH